MLHLNKACTQCSLLGHDLCNTDSTTFDSAVVVTVLASDGSAGKSSTLCFVSTADDNAVCEVQRQSLALLQKPFYGRLEVQARAQPHVCSQLQSAMQFTEAQQQDLMLLRRLFFGKLGVLARERRECLKRMPYGAAATAHDMNSRLAEIVTIAQELHEITAAEFQTKLQFTSAYRRGVSSASPHVPFFPAPLHFKPPPPLPPQPPLPPPHPCSSLLHRSAHTADHEDNPITAQSLTLYPAAG